MNKTQFQEILISYEREKYKNNRIMMERKAEVYEKIPEYSRIEQSISSTAVSKIKALLSDEPGDLSKHDSVDFEADTRKKRQRLEALLVQNGFPKDYLAPIYTCPHCKDTGYLSGSEKCGCLRQKIAASLYEHSGLKEILETENFNHVNREYFEGEDLVNFEKNYQKACDFVKNFASDYRNLYFYGTVGTGKSFLSYCIAKEIMDQGYQVVYFSANQLFEKLQLFRFSEAKLEQLEEIIFGCDLLILDDLATETPGDYAKSKLLSLLNERAIAKKSTIISSNVSLNELDAHYSERIFSRIVSQYDLLKFTGPDLRIKKKLNK